MFQQGREMFASFLDTTVRDGLHRLFTPMELSDEHQAALKEELDAIIDEGLDDAVDDLRKEIRYEGLFQRVSEIEDRLDVKAAETKAYHQEPDEGLTDQQVANVEYSVAHAEGVTDCGEITSRIAQVLHVDFAAAKTFYNMAHHGAFGEREARRRERDANGPDMEMTGALDGEELEDFRNLMTEWFEQDDVLHAQGELHGHAAEMTESFKQYIDDLPDEETYLNVVVDDSERFEFDFPDEDDIVISDDSPPTDMIDDASQPESARIRQLLCRCTNQSRTINEQQDDIQGLTSDLALQTEFARNANTAVIEMTAKHHKAATTVGELTDFNKILQIERSERSEELERLSKQLNAPAQRKFKEYEDAIDALESEAFNKDETINELTTQVAGLRGAALEAQALRVQLSDVTNDAIDEEAEMNTIIAGLERELSEMTETKEIWKKSSASLQARLDAAINEGDGRIQKLNDIVQRMTDERGRNHDLIHQLQDDLHFAQNANVEGHRTLERRNDELTQHVSTIDVLSRDLEGCRTEIARLKHELKKEKNVSRSSKQS